MKKLIKKLFRFKKKKKSPSNKKKSKSLFGIKKKKQANLKENSKKISNVKIEKKQRRKKIFASKKNNELDFKEVDFKKNSKKINDIQNYLNDKNITIAMTILLFCICLFLPMLDDKENIEQNNPLPIQTEDTIQNEEAENLISEIEQMEPVSLEENSTFSILFIDVGQADAALVECDGHYMLIDGGNREDSDLIYTVLKDKNISHLDIIVGSHAHEDHIGGIAGALNFADADLILCPTDQYDSDAFDNFKKYAEKNGNGIVIPNAGDTYSLGSSLIEILGVNTDVSTNNSSIVLMITYGKTKFLFTGDIENEAENKLIEGKKDLSATVLKVAHHGSDTSSTGSFLQKVMCEYAIISVGKDNSYQLPNDNILKQLHDADIQLYRTDLQGDILCSSDKENVTFFVEKNENADTFATVHHTEQIEEASNKDVEPTLSDYDYILNTNSKKFHDPSCSSADKISNKNKEYYIGNAEDLVEIGYEPCDICKPYTIIKATPTPTPKPTATPTSVPTETMVWIPNSGSKYHSRSNCSNMKKPTQVSKSEAESRGYTRCKKCW